MKRLRPLAIGIGSNLGDRRENLRLACGRIAAELHEGTSPPLLSGIYETEPVDCAPGTPPFLNMAIQIECSAPPAEVLAWTKACEVAAGRPADHGFHEPRTLDLDLLFYGDLSVDEPGLILPHPRIAERLFVLAPLADIAPHKILPGCPRGVWARLREIQNPPTPPPAHAPKKKFNFPSRMKVVPWKPTAIG